MQLKSEYFKFSRLGMWNFIYEKFHIIWFVHVAKEYINMKICIVNAVAIILYNWIHV